MSDGMRRELVYLSSHATNRYFIPNWGIIYPKEDGDSDNPFKSNKLRDLCTRHLKKISRFYKISISVPTISR